MKRVCVLILLIFVCVGCGKKEEEKLELENPNIVEEDNEIPDRAQ